MNNNNSLPGPHEPDSTRPASPLARLVSLRPGETAPLLWSAAYFFCALFAVMLLRPMRETFGVRGDDLNHLPLLWTGTTAAMLLAAPLFAWLVSRMPRRKFIPITYRAFAATLLVFYALLLLTDERKGTAIGYAFYIWFSVFNLFAVSVFWGFMADIWNTEQSRRVFGAIAVGGTLGAIAGLSVPAFLATSLGDPEHLLPISVVMLEAAVFCVARLVGPSAARAEHTTTSPTPTAPRPEPSRSVWRGFVLLARSPYLMAMGVYMLIYTLSSTFLYFEQSRIVAAAAEDDATRTALFARIDFARQTLTLLTQLFLTARIVRGLGIITGLSLVPLVTMLGAAALWAAPSLGLPLLITLGVVQGLRGAAHHAVDRPSREMLYAPLGPDEKYKTKSFIDTFVYRAGDLLGAWANVLKPVVAAFEPILIGLALAALGVAAFLAAGYRRAVAKRDTLATESSPPA